VINRTEIGITDIHKDARLKPSLDHPRLFRRWLFTRRSIVQSPESLSFKPNLRVPSSSAVATVSRLGNQSGLRRAELFDDYEDAAKPANGPSALRYCVNNDLI
jgi:hypothetical protein